MYLFKKSISKIKLLPKLTDDQFIDYCYTQLLERKADKEGKKSHLKALRQGIQRGELLLSFIQSEEYANRESNTTTTTFAPPGHFYSPLPDIELVKSRYLNCFDEVIDKNVINLNIGEQLELLKKFSEYHSDLPFSDQPSKNTRYGYINDQFGYGDAIVLYSFLRYLAPKRVIEVGSGHSTAVMLDTNEKFLNHQTQITCIEPFPDRLYNALTERDKQNTVIIEKPVQDVSSSIFMELEKGDILFIDSSHVAKFGSDLLYLMFNILPIIKPGVIVHFHDIFWPFEYTKEWLLEGRAWNEAYFLRAFLSYNSNFKIMYFNHFIHCKHSDKLEKYLPLAAKNAGCSVWLEKVN